MQSATLRTFFACQISPENLAQIEQLLAELESPSSNAVKWVNPKNLHLTLKFIGDFKQADIDRIKPVLAEALSAFESFPINIHTLSAFPSLDRPQVVWLGLTADPALFQLVKTVEKQCEHLNYPAEKRPFAAHITIGRLRSSATPAEKNLISKVIRARQSIDIGKQRIDALHFYKSELTPAGPIYQILFTLPFTS